MTGFFMRIERKGTFQNVDMDTLSDAELEAFSQSQEPERGWPWAIVLAKWIRDNVTEQRPS